MKKKKNMASAFVFILFLVCGVGIGIQAGRMSERIGSPIGILYGVLFFYAAFILGIIIHEAGHMIFGLMTGYKFQSFRVFNLMLIKTDEGFKWKKFSLMGTGGQCIMSPPDMVDGKIPVGWYNMGGAIMNFLTGVVLFVIYYMNKNTVAGDFCMMGVILSAAMAFTNAFPVTSKEMSNDGANAISLGKNPEALRAFWLQLKMNSEIAKGVRLCDMPKEWFRLPDEEEMQNSMIATEAAGYCNYLMDNKKYEEAEVVISQLVNGKNAISGLHRSLLVCDEIFCMILRGDEKEKIDALLERDPMQRKVMKSMANFPSVIRTWYAYDLCVLKDEEKANMELEKFEKMAKTYPYPVELIGEREMLDKVRKTYMNCNM